MKKRILSLLLLVATIVTALPLVTFSVGATEAPEAPLYGAEEYDALYVKDGLIQATDFFKTNTYWNTEGKDYSMPLGLYEGGKYKSYEYGGKTYDLTDPDDALTYRVVVKKTGGTKDVYFYYDPARLKYNKDKNLFVDSSGNSAELTQFSHTYISRFTSYEDEAEANAAATAAKTAIDAAIKAGMAGASEADIAAKQALYTCEVRYHFSDAYLVAYNDWTVENNAWYTQFMTANGGHNERLTNWYNNASIAEKSNAEMLAYVKATQSTLAIGDGFAVVRDEGTFHVNGGLNVNDLGSYTNTHDNFTAEVVGAFSPKTKTASSQPFMLFYNVRYYMSHTNGLGYVAGIYTGFAVDTSKEENVFSPKSTFPVDGKSVATMVYTLSVGAGKNDDRVTVSQVDKTLLDLTGDVPSKNSTFYVGWHHYTDDMRVYAIRNYARELTDAEKRQNHLADLMKFYRLDLGYIRMLDDTGLAAVALSVKDVEISDGYEAVRDAVQNAARREAEAKYAHLDLTVFGVLAAYGLNVDYLEIYPAHRLPHVYAFLSEGYLACEDGNAVQAGYAAAFEADLAANWAGNAMTPDDYNNLYVRDGMTIGLDWYLNNEYWGYTETAPDAAIYKWCWKQSQAMKQSKFAATVKNGALVMTGDTYIGDTGVAANYGVDGMTGEFVFVDADAPGGTYIDYNDMRFGAASRVTPIVRLNAIGFRDTTNGVLRTEAEDGAEMGWLNKPYDEYRVGDGAAVTFSVAVDRQPMPHSFYEYVYPADVYKTKKDGTLYSNSSSVYATHEIKDGVLVERATHTGGVWAFWIPVYYTHTDGMRYVVDLIKRTDNNGKDMNAAYATVDKEGNITLSETGKDFYNANPGYIAVYRDGKTVLERKDVYYANNSKLVGGTYLFLGYATTRTLYAHRDYSRVLSAEEIAQNHFADIAKCFRLDLTGIELLNKRALQGVYAAVAHLDVATATRREAQLAVSAAITRGYDTSYDDLLAAGVERVAVEAARLVGANITLLEKLPLGVMKETYLTLSAILRGYEEGEPDALLNGAERVAAAMAADLAVIDKQYTLKDYNDLYVKNGALMLLDYYALNSYWGETMPLPQPPTEKTDYYHDVNNNKKDDGESEHFDFTKVENRLADSTTYILMRQKGNDYLTWSYLNSSSAFTAAGTRAGGAAAKTYPTEAAALDAAFAQSKLTERAEGAKSFTGADGYTYYVAAKAIAEGAAWKAARDAYIKEINALMNKYAVDGVTTSTLSQYITPHGTASHHSPSGNVFVAPIITPQADGSMKLLTLHSNTYVGVGGMPKTGAVHAELVINAGVPAAGQASTAGYFFTLRSAPLSGTVNANGATFTNIAYYDNTSGVTFKAPLSISGSDTVFTLSYLDERSAPKTDTYVLIRTYLNDKGATVYERLNVDTVAEAYRWTLNSSKYTAKEFDSMSAAYDAAYAAAGLERGADGQFTSGKYTYYAQPSRIADRKGTIGINGEDLVEFETVDVPTSATDKNDDAGNTMIVHGSNYFSYSLYAARYYNRALSDTERAQNHFADLAKYYRLDLGQLALLDTADLPGLYSAMAGLQIFNSTRTDVMAAYYGYVKSVVREDVEAAYPELAEAYPSALRAAVEYSLDLGAYFTSDREVAFALADVKPATFLGATMDEAGAILADMYHDAYYYLAYKQDGPAAWCEWLDEVIALDTNLALEQLMALPKSLRYGITEAEDHLTQAGVDAYVSAKRAELGLGVAMTPADYNRFYVQDGLLIGFDVMQGNAHWGGLAPAALPAEPGTYTDYYYDVNNNKQDDGKSEHFDFTKIENRLGAYNFKRSAPDSLSGDTVKYKDTYPMNSKSYATVADVEAAVKADAAALFGKAANGYTDYGSEPTKTTNNGVTTWTFTAKWNEKDVTLTYTLVDEVNAAWRQATKEYFDDVKAWMEDYTYYPTAGKTAVYLAAYNPVGDSGNCVRHIETVDQARPPFYLEGGYLLMHTGYSSDGSIKVMKAWGDTKSDSYSLQMTASYGKTVMPHILANVRATVTNNGATYQYSTTFKTDDFKPSAANVTVGAARSTTAVEALTYTLTNGKSNKSEAGYSVSTHTGENLITATATYTNNDTTLIGYGHNVDGMKIYAIRYYNAELTAAEKLQNHFVDLAKYYKLDLAEYAALTPEEQAEIHEAMKGFAVADSDRADVLEVYCGLFYDTDYAALEGKLDADLLEIAEYLCLDLSAVLAVKDSALWNGIVAPVTESYAMGYAMEREVVQAVLDDAAFFLESIGFAGMSVRVSDGWSVDTPGVRGCFTVNEAALMRLAGKENVTFGVEILNKDGVVKATLTFTPTFGEDGSITYEGKSVSASNPNGVATLQDGEDAGIKTFAYTVIYNDYTASGGKNYQTAEYYNAEYAYRSFLEVDGDRYERDLAHDLFDETITAAEVYKHFYTHPEILDKTKTPYAENKLVKAVMAELGLLTPAE